MARDVTIVLKAQDQYSATLQQFNKDVGNIGTTTKELTDSGNKTNSMMSGFVGNLNAAALGFIGWKGAQMVSDLNELGHKANKAKDVFEELTRPLGGYTENIQALQKATGGVVDNMTLMEGSSKLVQMGLATTTPELASMYEMAVKLGSSMGMDVTKSLSDFSLMLANNSIMRLDQFGISSGRVRDRMNELAEQFEGMSKSDRFKLAVLEEGGAALDRLGGAAEAAETPLARIGTSISNMAQAFAGDFSTGVNSLAGILEIAMGGNPIQVGIRNQAETDAAVYLDLFRQKLATEGLGGLEATIGVEGIKQTLAEAFEQVAKAGGGSLTESLGFGATVTGIDKAVLDTITEAQELANITQELENAAAQNDRINTIMQEQLAIHGDITAEQETYQRNLTAIQQLEAEDLQRQEVKRQIQQSYSDDLLSISNALSDAYTTGGFNFNPSMMGGDLTSGALSMPKYMTRSEADAIAEAYGEIQGEMSRIKELADKDLITKEQLAAAETMGNNLEFMASEADKAAEAFENMKLGDVFGQSSGGMQGEMTDMVIQQMKDKGATPEAIAAMQRELDLGSGRETNTSLMMQEQIAPAMAALAPQMAASMMENFNTLFEQAALQGLNQSQIGKLMQDPAAMQQGYNPYASMLSFGMVGADATQFSGGMWGDTTMTQQLGGGGKGKGSTENTAAMKSDLTSINKDAANTSKSFDLMQSSTTIINGMISKIKTAVETIEGTKEIIFKIGADDPQGILVKLGALLGGTSLSEIVKDNGGKVPGATGGSSNNR